MPPYNRIAELQDDMKQWRQDIHKHPELCYEEVRTAKIVADKLREWGLEVHEGIGVTGVVGVLKGQGNSNRAIGIRADMDALPMQEMTGVPYQSVHEGKMHACGHDGHTAILLGAAKYLSETRNFDGTVNFIFQPAEEGGGGGDAMVKDGLFERFPCDGVYGLHNQPMMPKGTFNIKSGPLMASADAVEFMICGKGGHAAHPQFTVDPIKVGVQLHIALQTIVSRNVSPVDSAVISVTMFEAGTAQNIIPHDAKLTASVRTTTPEVRDFVEKRIKEIAAGVGATFGAEITVNYQRFYPCTVNHEKETEILSRAAIAVVGEDRVDTNTPVRMGSEDFSFMLEACPGAYIFLGTNDEDHNYSVHHPKFDFNDEVLGLGASLWAKLVEQEMPRS
ncbi:M20 aminoacylase family protein [Sneathiella chinensis]|uniref:Amidohydrolase n=1 Tax=Sneathiella chinensis TaxID=349750 RepID=A0ABQ5U135_9PROT|nr:M20 aminoacylase family protein [Sneathiella chinensis]GLQ05019.1 amidohydrolase [Sneathiella chinensis]